MFSDLDPSPSWTGCFNGVGRCCRPDDSMHAAVMWGFISVPFLPVAIGCLFMLLRRHAH
ncbi:MAG TPA: hypothetical protein VHL59_09535 [Thermoanaerobaculia bacterium]|nr:hypothetical protein [Thermoanaerobaculia bacterium]